MEDEKKITIRMPGALHTLIARLAKLDRRSLNAELIVLLEEAAKARQTQKSKQ